MGASISTNTILGSRHYKNSIIHHQNLILIIQAPIELCATSLSLSVPAVQVNGKKAKLALPVAPCGLCFLSSAVR